MRPRPATPEDAEAIARIYNQGIEERIATFETRPRSAGNVLSWLGGAYPTVAMENEGGVLAFAATSAYSPRECYAGVAEFSVYTARWARCRGAGRMAMAALLEAAKRAGFWKLVSRVFVDADLAEAATFRGPPRETRPDRRRVAGRNDRGAAVARFRAITYRRTPDGERPQRNTFPLSGTTSER